MAQSNLGELTELIPIDYGGCGEVRLGRDAAGELRALKVYDDLSVNKPLLAKMSQRLRVDGWPDGVLPVYLEQFDRRPLSQVMAFLGDQNADGSWTSRSLQNRIESFPNGDAWGLVKGLAYALSQMHIRHVAHGNLKPGNVFIGDQGEVLLSDWCLGNMPNVHVFHFTDALLYQAPEQLLDPGGYNDEAGYGWDVFAFGVLAFRLLTGSFPRCHETFSQVAPPQGTNRSEGVKADPAKIASNLKASALMEWPDKPQSELEKRMREWIDRCLLIDPAKRPVSMMEVCAGFELIERELAEENEHQRLLNQRKRADRRSSVLMVAWLASVVVALFFAGLWKLDGYRLSTERQQITEERVTLHAAMKTAEDSEINANARAAQAISALNHEREVHLAQLEASRLIGDRLFGWALKKGRRRLPPIDGREFRLKQLETYYLDFIKQAEGVPALEEEVARARLHLAELSISKESLDEADVRMGEALSAWSGKADDAMKLRLATDLLVIAMLRESRSGEKSHQAFQLAREAFAKVPRLAVDQDRWDQLVAVLDYHEAKLMLANGHETKALEQLMKATKTLNRLSIERPDTIILKSELADCYLASAGVLEGIGQLGDAREVRLLAAQELAKLLKASPDDPVLQLDLAGCYAAMAEAAMLSGDVDSVNKRSKEALSLLDRYLGKRPSDMDALVLKAAQHNLQAGIHRDQGNAGAALDTYNQSLRILEGVHAKKPNHVMASYRLALTWWQQGKMQGMVSKRRDEIVLLTKAADLLTSLEKPIQESGPRPEQWMRSRAYLAGDLGHALQSLQMKDESRKAFAQAVSYWQALVKMRPKSEEYDAGLSWCQQRLERIK